MQYLEFQKYFSPYVIFSIKEIEKVFPNFNKINLLSWQKKEFIVKLRNGWYKFSNINNDEILLFFIANKIYSPSYISLESALSFYGVIPEAVFSVNSITTLKTNKFENKLGKFNYFNIKSKLFFGYQLLQKDKSFYLIAEIEKTILDYFYLKSSLKTLEDIKSLRLNKSVLQEKLDFKKLTEYATVFNSKVLLNKINILKQFLND